METFRPEPAGTPSGRPSSWVFACVLMWFVAALAFAFAVHQFVLKYLYDQSSYTRTLGGILLILLGFAGIALPIVLRRRRLRFLSLRSSRQWLIAVGVPLVYVLVLAVCLEASHRSRTILLPRPFVPTAVVLYRPGDSRVEFRGGWRPDVGLRGYNDAEVQADGSEEFSSYLSESFIRDAQGGIETVAIVGRARPGDDGSVEITLEVDAREAIRFDVENLDDVTIQRDGRAIAEAESQKGKFRVTITGQVKGGV